MYDIGTCSGWCALLTDVYAGYKVMYTADMTQDEDEWAEDHISGDKLSTVIKNLSPDTHYYFKIRARNSRGYGPGSPTVIFLTMSGALLPNVLLL